MYITIVGDLHFDHYTEYSFYDGFRDDQFVRLVDRIIEESRKRGSVHLVLAGDIIERPYALQNPATMFKLINLLKKLSSYFEKIYYILGQHDLAHRNKKAKIKYDDSIVNIFDQFGVMEYCDDKTIQLGGRNIYMRNWTDDPKKIILPCPKGTDLFIGHASICRNYQPCGYLVRNEFGEWEESRTEVKDRECYQLFGFDWAQKMVKDTYKLGVFGDIHQPIDPEEPFRPNVHSTGCPLQKSMSDDPYGTFAFVELETLNFERVRVIDDKNKFLRIYNEGEDIPDQDEYTWIWKKNEKASSIVLDKNPFKKGGGSLEISLKNINNIVRDQVVECGLKSVHEEFLDIVKPKDPINMEFELISLEVNNYRSIDHYVLNFKELRDTNHPRNIIYVHGENGSGKSTLAMALRTALLGDRRIEQHKKEGSTGNVRVKVTLMYNQAKYVIERAKGLCNFFINDVPSNDSKMKDTEEKIFKTLPFLSYLDTFFVSHRDPFYARFKNSKLLENMFNLDALVQLSEVSSNQVKAVKKSIEKAETNIASITGSSDILLKLIEEKNTQLKELVINEDPDLEKKRNICLSNPKLIEDKRKELEGTKAKIEKNPYKACENIDKLRQQYKELDKILKDINQIATLTKRQEEIQDLIKGKTITCDKCGNKIEIGTQTLNQELTEIASNLQTLRKSTANYTSDNCRAQMVEIEKQGKEHNEYLKYEQSQSVYKDRILALEKQIDDLTAELNLVTSGSTVQKVLEYCDSIRIKISQRNELRAEKERREKELSENTQKLEDEKKTLSTLLSKQKDYETYMNLFNLKSEGSLYKMILAEISKTLSGEDIQFFADEEGNTEFCLRVGNVWREYSVCSDGQRVYMDLLLLQQLSTLLGKIGFMSLDEVGANLDTSRHEVFADIIKKYNVTDMFVMMHSDSFTSFDHSLLVEHINDSSKFTMK